MRFTIIRDTGTVAVDMLAFEVDCSALPFDVHAVQWDGTSGEIEYKMTQCSHCGARSKKHNEPFTDPAPYQPLLDAWDVKRRAALEEAAKLEAERVAKMGEGNAT